jgi:protein gp37
MFAAQARYGRDPSVVVRTNTWRDPLRWQTAALKSGQRRLVFTCSWSDWFHAAADGWRAEAWTIIRACPKLTFQILTKRPERILPHLPADWGNTGYKNVWLGISVSDANGIWRVDQLRHVPARVRFISYEPALGPLAGLDLAGIQWLIYGGESGPGHRADDTQWARDVRDLCRRSGTRFFYKQSAGPRPGTGITLDGEIVKEYPL